MIKEDWTEGKLEDLLNYVQPTNYIVDSTAYNDTYKTPVLTAGKTFILGYTNEENNIFTELPVIIFDDFTTVTKYVNFKFKVKSSAMKILVPTSDEVNVKYVYYYMQTIRYNVDTHKRYWISIFSKLNISIAPLPEQRAIVAKIEELFSELDSGIDSLKKARKQLEVYRQAVSKAAFEGKLTKEWRKENKNFSTTDDLIKEIEKERSDYYNNLIMKWKDDVKEWEDGKTEKKPSRPRKIKEINPIEDDKLLNVIPKSWEWTRLSNIVLDSSNDIVDGPFGSNLKSTEYIDSGYPVLRIQNIKANRFINKNFKYISFDKYNSLSRHHFRTGDLIVTKLGNPLGLTCRVPSYMKEGVIVADLIRISPTLKHINYNWLTYLLNSEVIQAQFRKITKGTTRPRMNLTIMRDTIIPICSIEEQTQIVAAIESRISVCENIEANIEEALEKAEALRHSILKKAFEGKLLSKEELEVCKQEDDWEPSEKLLKRIKEATKEVK